MLNLASLLRLGWRGKRTRALGTAPALLDPLEPRALLTITLSPFLIPWRCANAVPISTKALGTRPAAR